MAYTFGGLKQKNASNDFSGLRVDGNRVAMTGVLGNYMQSMDATTSPVYSPISNGSASGLVLKVPNNAAQITLFIASSVTALVGEDSTFTYGLFIPTATLVTLDCANQQYIYIKPSSGTNSIYFQFKIV